MGEIRRLLVANRGEIARRVIRAARAGGIATVAVFAEDDRGSPHVAEADVAVPLGAGPPACTYLDVAAIVGAAVRAGADALHPGYGFLSEDPRLAEGCAAAGIVWVGPPPAAMAAMANKAEAKRTVAAAGVPVLEGRPVLLSGGGVSGAEVGGGVAGTEVAGTEVGAGVSGGRVSGTGDALVAAGAEIGYPLLVKAAAGGGGRGMRLVGSPADLGAAVVAAAREAQASFGSGEVFLERYVISPRHVEVQIVADRHGNVVHLFDRECSIQRRHQKVVEEAPAVLVGEETRRTMWQAAVGAARSVGYEGVGTVEFVVDDAGRPYFLEMNTRLQVEHGVTELVTGVDLVRLQLRVAAGEPLFFDQEAVAATGHAVEVRLCAEKPSEGYRPAPGRVAHVRWPSGEGVRVDAGVESGTVVSAAYDSLLAKVMAWGDDRSVAIARLRSALGGPLELDGIETNRDLVRAVLAEPDFLAGCTSTDYLERHEEVVVARVPAEVCRLHAAAAALFLEHERGSSSLVLGVPPSWRNVGSASHVDRFEQLGGGSDSGVEVSLSRRRGRLTIEVTGPAGLPAGPIGEGVGAEVTADPRTERRGTVKLEVDGLLHVLGVRADRELIAVSSSEWQATFLLAPAAGDRVDGDAFARECRAPLPGSVVRLLVSAGDEVVEGSGLVVMEAMKMEHTLRAAAAGTVAEVLVAAGRQVDLGDLLVVVE